MRNPIMIWGNAAGKTTLAMSWAGESPKFRPARRYIEGTLRTPFMAATMMGKNEARNMRKVAAALPTPNQMMETGIQAMGLIGRTIWIVGFTTAAAAGYHPRNNPAGMPMAAAVK